MGGGEEAETLERESETMLPWLAQVGWTRVVWRHFEILIGMARIAVIAAGTAVVMERLERPAVRTLVEALAFAGQDRMAMETRQKVWIRPQRRQDRPGCPVSWLLRADAHGPAEPI